MLSSVERARARTHGATASLRRTRSARTHGATAGLRRTRSCFSVHMMVTSVVILSTKCRPINISEGVGANAACGRLRAPIAMRACRSGPETRESPCAWKIQLLHEAAPRRGFEVASDVARLYGSGPKREPAWELLQSHGRLLYRSARGRALSCIVNTMLTPY